MRIEAATVNYDPGAMRTPAAPTLGPLPQGHCAAASVNPAESVFRLKFDIDVKEFLNMRASLLDEMKATGNQAPNPGTLLDITV